LLNKYLSVISPCSRRYIQEIKAFPRCINTDADKEKLESHFQASLRNGKNIIQLVKICGLPMERYFNPEVMREESELRQRVGQKLKLCPEQYLPIVEGAIDGALKIEKPNEETEGV
jgi:hypothetical protein